MTATVAIVTIRFFTEPVCTPIDAFRTISLTRGRVGNRENSTSVEDIPTADLPPFSVPRSMLVPGGFEGFV